MSLEYPLCKGFLSFFLSTTVHNGIQQKTINYIKNDLLTNMQKKNLLKLVLVSFANLLIVRFVSKYERTSIFDLES